MQIAIHDLEIRYEDDSSGICGPYSIIGLLFDGSPQAISAPAQVVSPWTPYSCGPQMLDRVTGMRRIASAHEAGCSVCVWGLLDTW